MGIRGFAHWSGFRWYALWNNDGRLCFQVGSNRWFADEGWSASIKTARLTRTFRLARASELALKHTYCVPLLAALQRRIDVAWDDLDEGLSDFFRWAADIWSDRDHHEHFLQDVWRGQPYLKSLP